MTLLKFKSYSFVQENAPKLTQYIYVTVKADFIAVISFCECVLNFT